MVGLLHVPAGLKGAVQRFHCVVPERC